MVCFGPFYFIIVFLKFVLYWSKYHISQISSLLCFITQAGIGVSFCLPFRHYTFLHEILDGLILRVLVLHLFWKQFLEMHYWKNALIFSLESILLYHSKALSAQVKVKRSMIFWTFVIGIIFYSIKRSFREKFNSYAIVIMLDIITRRLIL